MKWGVGSEDRATSAWDFVVFGEDNSIVVIQPKVETRTATAVTPAVEREPAAHAERSSAKPGTPSTT